MKAIKASDVYSEWIALPCLCDPKPEPNQRHSIACHYSMPRVDDIIAVVEVCKECDGNGWNAAPGPDYEITQCPIQERCDSCEWKGEIITHYLKVVDRLPITGEVTDNRSIHIAASGQVWLMTKYTPSNNDESFKIELPNAKVGSFALQVIVSSDSTNDSDLLPIGSGVIFKNNQSGPIGRV